MVLGQGAGRRQPQVTAFNRAVAIDQKQRGPNVAPSRKVTHDLRGAVSLGVQARKPHLEEGTRRRLSISAVNVGANEETRQRIYIMNSIVRIASLGLSAFVLLAALSGAAHATGSTPDPLYRLRNNDHLFTTSFDEVISAIENYGYIYEGIAAKCFTSPQPGTEPLYRLNGTRVTDHFYTTSEQEAEIAVVQYGYVREGIACYVYGSQAAGSCPFYRVALSNGTHFFTQSWHEILNVLGAGGNTYEGVAAYLPPNGNSCPQ
jgi:hypothetical protein